MCAQRGSSGTNAHQRSANRSERAQRAAAESHADSPAGELDQDDLCPGEDAGEPAPPVVRGSRWIDYDTHELLEMISELEDERRWARLREGFWLAILIHLVLLSAVTWIPKYVFRFRRWSTRRDQADTDEFTYLDTPRVAAQGRAQAAAAASRR